jgi:hypothetical protein
MMKMVCFENRKEINMERIPDPSRDLPVLGDVDVLVIGGGMTGVAAALAAARQGARTMIVEQFNCLGGVATSGGHNELSTYNAWSSQTRVLGGIPYELGLQVQRDEEGVIENGELFFDTEAMKVTLDRLVAKAGIDVLYYTLFADTLVKDGKVWGVVVQNKSGRQAIRARQVIDCTGDADVAAQAGVPFHQGRDGDGLCQPATLMFTLRGVDWPRVQAWWTDWKMEHVWKKAQADGIMEAFQSVIMGFIHTDLNPDQVSINMTHLVRVDTTNTRDISAATIEGRRQAHHLTDVFRKVVPGMENAYLISTAPSLGTRESRRIVGEVILTEQDLLNRREWEDPVCYGSFFIDIHNPAGPGMSEQTLNPEQGFHYQIPYRVLVPQQVENLLVAGRCISVTHEALGSTRVMLTCMALGEAAGTAAALSIQQGTTPRALPYPLLREQLLRQGVILSEKQIEAENA